MAKQLCTRVLCLAVFALFAAPASGEVIVLLNFGGNDVNAQDDNGNYWNQHEGDPGQDNLVDTDNNATAIDVEYNDAATTNDRGTHHPAGDLLASRLGVQNATGVRSPIHEYILSGLNGTPAPNVVTVTFSDLNPALEYSFALSGSREDTTAAYTRFTAQGNGAAISDIIQVQANGSGIAPNPNANNSEVAVLEDITPTAAGVIVVSFEGNTAADFSGDTTYGILSCMEIRVPEPATMALLGLGTLAGLIARRRRRGR